MIRPLTLGNRIASGFALLIAVSSAVGIFTISQVRPVARDAGTLAQQYMPEVELCRQLTTSAHEAMVGIESYSYTHEAKHFDAAQRSLAELSEAVKGTHNLAARSPELIKLREDIGAIEERQRRFVGLVNETKAKTDELEAIHSQMNSAAEKFISTIEGLRDAQLEAQRRELKEELGKESPAAPLLEERALKLAEVSKIFTLMNTIRIAAWKAQAERDFTLLEAAEKQFGEIIAILDKLGPITRKPEDITRLAEARAKTNGYQAAVHALAAIWSTLNDVGVRREAAAAELTRVVEDVMKGGIERTSGVAANANTRLATVTQWSVLSLCGAVLLGATLAVTITRSITRPLRAVAGMISDGADQVASAATQVSMASQTLADGASEQAASLEETSASLEEITSMIKRNAENARTARELSSQARHAADTGAEEMETMKIAMDAITTSSNEVGKIIKSIDEIAFQTNILALNAAVEAARAGEAGAGFAVVADEVRNLAQRSANAAKETARKIEDAIAKSQNGVEVSARVADSLAAIVVKARTMDELITEIAAASQEQSQGVAEINSAVTQMDRVTQSNASTAEESAAAAQQLTAQASLQKDATVRLSAMISGQPRLSIRSAAAPLQSPTKNSEPNNYRQTSFAPVAGSNDDIPMPATNNRTNHLPAEEDFRDF